MNKIPQNKDPFRQLVEIMRHLRAPDGCPWDREQTHQTLKKYLIEETSEALEAIDQQDDAELCSELGDVALQIVFHAQIAEEEGRFTIDDSLRAICEKLIRRHPHVFGDQQADNADQVLEHWIRIKKEEKREAKGLDSDKTVSALEGVPHSLPALHRAQRVQEKASHVGFDWREAEGAFAKIEEEIEEVRQTQAQDDNLVRQGEELGDLLFAIVNYARLKGFFAEDLLRQAVRKFETRFQEMEKRIRKSGQAPEDLTLEEMDQIWNSIKAESNPSAT